MTDLEFLEELYDQARKMAKFHYGEYLKQKEILVRTRKELNKAKRNVPEPETRSV